MTDLTEASRTARHLRVAVTQWHATLDVGKNLDLAELLIDASAADGAELVLLPENCLCLGTNTEMRDRALDISGPELRRLADAARRASSTVILGGFKRRVASGEIRNTATVIAPTGDVVATYDKIHLFDATVEGKTFAASTVEQPGDSSLMVDLAGAKVGVTICYDLRFPELYRTLAVGGAEVFVVPAAFTQATGRAHWEILLRARAIENLAFVVASATISDADDTFPTYGHAMIVGPWGEILVNLGTAEPAHATVELDLGEVASARSALPVLSGVRPTVSTAPPANVSV